MADSEAQRCGVVQPLLLPRPDTEGGLESPRAELHGASHARFSARACPAGTRRRGKRAWRKFSWAYLQRVEDIADGLLPPDDRVEGAALVASLNEAAAVGIRPAHGFDVRGARCVPGHVCRGRSCCGVAMLRCRGGDAVVCRDAALVWLLRTLLTLLFLFPPCLAHACHT